MNIAKFCNNFKVFLTLNIVLSIPLFCLFVNYNSHDLHLTYSYDDEPSDNNVLESIDLNVLIELRIKNKYNSYEIPIWIAHLNNGPIYQQSDLINREIPDNFQRYEYGDNYSNKFDYIEGNLDENQEIVIRYSYKITLRRGNYSGVIQPYNTSDKIFELFCNKTEVLHDIHDPDLILASNSLVNQSDSPIEKAEKISNFVYDYLTYSENKVDEGASWAYIYKTGDCDEFSSLLVTLLRIQGIPTRRVGGYCLYKGPTSIDQLNPNLEMAFISTKTEDDFQRHAWVEYYVEGIGWIQCDPTWNSFNHDSLDRISMTIGTHFTLYGRDNVYTCFSDPIFSITKYTDYVYKVRLSQSNIDFSENFEELSVESIYFSIICFSIIFAGICYIVTIKRR